MKNILILLTLFFLPLSAQALGVSVSPSKLEIIQRDDNKTSLIITNISSETISVSVFSDDFKDYISISPAQFELLPEEKIKVNVLANFDDKETLIKRTDVSIVSQTLDKKSFNAASGIKIPLSVYIINKQFQWSGALVFLVVFFGVLLLLAFLKLFFWFVRPKKKKKFWPKVNFLKRRSGLKRPFYHIK